ncbi:MAG: molybdopterin converting factor [Planctomycetes bacterium]|nr:molybdopterin converting factor [Planctomycetota bacterium]
MPDSAGPIHVTLRCFAAVRDILDTDTVTVEIEAGTTARGMLEKLGQQHPALLRVPVAFAVNRDYARADSVLSDGDEVAFIPPISGGSGAQDLYRFDLTEGELDPRALEQECRTDRDGAVVTFAGTTRDHNEGAQVLSLSYEAYTEMAQRVMCVLFEEAVKRFPITRARVAHRLGEVPVGEASVIVVVASAHRGPAFEACRFLMDRLKDEVPIWKREKLCDGAGERWIGDLPKPAT